MLGHWEPWRHIFLLLFKLTWWIAVGAHFQLDLIQWIPAVLALQLFPLRSFFRYDLCCGLNMSYLEYRKTEISRKLKGIWTRVQVMLHVWVLAHLKIQEMKPSSSNFAVRGITDLSGALPLFWHYFIIPDNLAFLFLFLACCSPEPTSDCVLTGSTRVTVVHKKIFSSLASSQTLSHYTHFKVYGSRYFRQAWLRSKDVLWTHLGNAAM